ncbi:hypothetical protein DENSPDRAFT_919017 [Dentipellis sp. KUC8613]|nr:hypothetical protein DENSPDRAFT_919017 [Dentipellis sp. KUC8613]
MSDAPAALRAALLALVGVCYHTCVTPPNRAPSASERAKAQPADPLGFRIIRRSQVFNQTVLWTFILSDTAAHFPTHPLSARLLPLLPLPVSQFQPGPARITAPLALGITLVLAGTALRTASYRALGRLFTFELALRDAHALVTRGPYALVRHPGYLGAVLAHTGMLLVGAAVGAPWLRTVGGRAAGAVVLGGVGWVMAGFVKRVRIEDALMRGAFGGEWEEWARRVRWRIVPGVF